MDIDVIYNEDCFEVLKRLDDNSIDAIITDPPYNLGFMGKKWDKTRIAFNLGLWKECLRVIKPGGNLLSFGGTRTYHRMVCAIEDAGFEIRDCIAWVYGQGLPKSLNIGKAVDKLQKNEREDLGKHPNARKTLGTIQICKKNGTGRLTKGTSEWEGYGTALKPAYEPIVLAMKPLDGTFAENCLKWGVGGLNIDGCRIEIEDKYNYENNCRGFSDRAKNKNRSDYSELYGHYPDTKTNIAQGRFPANFIHDGSQEVMELFPETGGGTGETKVYGEYHNEKRFNASKQVNRLSYRGNGSAARFFYCAKANKKERNMGCEGLEAVQPDPSRKEGNPGGDNPRNRGVHKMQNCHPTVKPLALMEYLVKLVTRPGHTVLDPFLGSGTTAIACVRLGRHYIGCELDKGYCEIAIKRVVGSV